MLLHLREAHITFNASHAGSDNFLLTGISFLRTAVKLTYRRKHRARLKARRNGLYEHLSIR